MSFLIFKRSFLSLFILLLINTLCPADEAVYKSEHIPYKSKECFKCHKDQKGESEELILDMPDLCYTCHESYENREFLHGPVAAGACTLCHDPHRSENKKLLRYPTINQMCTSCHADKGDMLKSEPVIHPPVKDKCTNCHDPHSQDHKFQLKADRKKDLCLGCHKEKKEWITKSKYKHGALKKGDECLNCHDPHASQQSKLLREPTSKDLCLKCHNKKIRADEDRKALINMAKHLDENPDWHGPILWGDCARCHNPHGSDNFRILQTPFPNTPTAKFNPKKYICFDCHDQRKIEDKFTSEFTNFRSGDKNIHFVHVKDRGITCRTCHDFHGTREYPHHLKIESSFGNAKFQLRYIETKNGGSCNPICHSKRSYDRLKIK